MSSAPAHDADLELNLAISAAMVELYATFYRHDETTAITYINENIVVCLLENVVITGNSDAFHTGGRSEFTAMIERLTHRHVNAFLSPDQIMPGVACELFLLNAAPLAAHRGSSAVATRSGSQSGC
jgi:mannose/fructose/N-acetylgalactosamine-specific phosphotransferase system component IIC